MRGVLKTNVWGQFVRTVADAAIGVAMVAAAAAALSGPAHARDGGWSGHGHWSGGGHWGGGWGHHAGYGHGGHYWGPSWGFSVGFPAYGGYYDPYYYDPYYYGRTVVVERPVAYGAAWPVYNQRAYGQAMSAPLGEAVSWDDGNTSGTVTAVRDGKADGRYCREFQQTIMIDGKRQQAFGAACQTPDGGWEIVPDNP